MLEQNTSLGNGTYDGAPDQTPDAIAGTETYHDSSLRPGADVAYTPVAFAKCGAGNLYLIPSEKIQTFIDLDRAVVESQGGLESKRAFEAEFEDFKISHVNEHQLYIKA